MQVLLATYGTRGDVEPMVALAVALQRLGAAVKVAAPPDREFVDLLTTAGVTHVPFAREYRSWLTADSTAEDQVFDVDAFVNDHVAATYDALLAAARESDVLVATGMVHFVARTAAEEAGIPNRFVVFSPTILAPQPWQNFVGPAISAHRASRGLPPVDDVATHVFTQHPWVAADPLLTPAAPAGGYGGPTPELRTGGWVLRDERALPAELEAFLQAGEAPIYVGFGSMVVTQEQAEATLQAARSLGRRVVLGRGWADAALPADAADAIAVGEVNQQALFGRVVAVVHHGGAGTTATAARAGAPQVIVPQAADQPFWGEGLVALGVGAVLDSPKPDGAAIEAALASVLTPETAARAARVAARIDTGGADEAARFLLAELGATPNPA